MAKNEFQIGKYYHIFNRGVDKRKTFSDKHDYFRFLESLYEFNQAQPIYSLFLRQTRGLTSKKNLEVKLLKKSLKKNSLCQIVCYNLLPNHYHLLIKEIKEGGISEFMKRLGGGYTGYFNRRHKRSGVLFQGIFKSVEVGNNRFLYYLIAYILGNSQIHNFGDPQKWRWSALKYLRNEDLLLTRLILREFKDKKEFYNYLEDVIKNSTEIKKEAKLLEF